ncbi:MAG: hypothetical protein AB2805_12290 [Candidatus Thiodiazotropha sp.]
MSERDINKRIMRFIEDLTKDGIDPLITAHHLINTGAAITATQTDRPEVLHALIGFADQIKIVAGTALINLEKNKGVK